MKSIITLSKNLINGKSVLSREMLGASDTIYIVNYDYTIESNATLYPGSELRIEGGSISGGNLILNHMEEEQNGKKYYSALTIGAPLSESGLPSTAPYLLSGTVLKSQTNLNYDLEIYGNCRIQLLGCPREIHKKYPDNTVKIKSSKEYNIQIDGKTDFNFFAENCTFQRIFSTIDNAGLNFEFVNSSETHILSVSLSNCRLWANDCTWGHGNNDVPVNSNFYCLNVGSATTQPARLILRDCVFDNMGVCGNVYIDNCIFLFGNNLNDNYEPVHCASHSRISNSIFEGHGTETNSDVIDTFNSQDVVIENCTFKNYKKYNPSGANIITIKSHYYDGDDINDNLPMDSNNIGQQIGVIVKNCFFDLPDFNGEIITVWNGPREQVPSENRSLNRQHTIIDSNIIKAPKAIFVGALSYTDHLTVCNNKGQVNMLVYTRDNIGVYNEVPNLTHDLIITGNTLAYYDSNSKDVSAMEILTGCRFNNLVLEGNKTNGYIWTGINASNIGELSGTIRIVNNETYGTRGIFRLDGQQIAKVPDDVNFFFSGNVSKGKKTDVGSYSEIQNPTDGILFVGRQYFCTTEPYKNKLLVYNGTAWVEA